MLKREASTLSVHIDSKPKCPPAPRRGHRLSIQATPIQEEQIALSVSVDLLEKLNAALKRTPDNDNSALVKNIENVLNECISRITNIRTFYSSSPDNEFLKTICSRLDAILESLRSSHADFFTSSTSSHAGFFTSQDKERVLEVGILAKAVNTLSIEESSTSEHNTPVSDRLRTFS